MKVLLTSILCALATSSYAAEPKAPPVRILTEAGTVLVNQGERYVTAKDGQALSPGDQVMVLAGGAANLQYADGCVLPVPGDSRVVVPARGACVKGDLDVKPGLLNVAGLGGPQAAAGSTQSSAGQGQSSMGEMTIDPNATEECTQESGVSSWSPSQSCREPAGQTCTVESGGYQKTVECTRYTSSPYPSYRPWVGTAVPLGVVAAVAWAVKDGEDRQVSD